jgi:type IV pilus assembly protein PilV
MGNSMHPHRPVPDVCRHPRRQSGVTLLEVLIAVLIVSFGLLGMAGLQSVGMKYNLAAAQRTAATMLANDIADRMRANMVGVNAGNYDAVLHGQDSAQANCLSPPGCTPAQMALNDVYEWRQAIKNALPGAANSTALGIVCRDESGSDGSGDASLVQASCSGGPASPMAVKMWWNDRSSTSNDPNTPSVNHTPPNFWVVFKP